MQGKFKDNFNGSNKIYEATICRKNIARLIAYGPMLLTLIVEL